MFSRIIFTFKQVSTTKTPETQALFLAKATEAKLLLLHVLSSEEDGYPEVPFFSGLNYYSPMSDEIMKDYLEQLETFKEQGLNSLRSHHDTVIALGVDAEITQISGTPGHTICNIAGNWGADIIIMGRRGLSGLKEAVLGSVSNYVTHHAPCSVLIINCQVHPKEKVSEVNRETLIAETK